MRIEARLVYPGVVNIYGSHGVGKTFLGWTLAAEDKAVYVVRPSWLKDIALGYRFTPESVVVLDNGVHERNGFRETMIDLESLGNPKVVVITRHPVDDYVFGVHLELTEGDIERVRGNLQSLGYSTDSSDWRDLWHGLLIASGVHYHDD